VSEIDASVDPPPDPIVVTVDPPVPDIAATVSDPAATIDASVVDTPAAISAVVNPDPDAIVVTVDPAPDPLDVTVENADVVISAPTLNSYEKAFVDGGAVALLFRDQPDIFLLGTAVHEIMPDTEIAKFGDGQWIEFVVSGTGDNASTPSGQEIQLSVGFGSETIQIDVPVETPYPVGATAGRWYVRCRIMSVTALGGRQHWSIEKDFKYSVGGIQQTSVPTREAQTTTQSSASTITMRMDVTLNNNSGTPVHTISGVQVYTYDEDTVSEIVAGGGSGLTDQDRVKLDSVEHDAQMNRELTQFLWCFNATNANENITNSVSGSPLPPPNFDWVTVKTGIIPQGLILEGGVIEFGVTGIFFTISTSLGSPPENLYEFRFLADGVPLTNPASGDVTMKTTQLPVVGVGNFSMDFKLQFGSGNTTPSNTGRQRLNGQFFYETAVAPVPIHFVDTFYEPTFMAYHVISDARGVELTLQMRSRNHNNDRNVIFLDGAYALVKSPFIPNRYEHT
jgi:hypothetical protein